MHPASLAVILTHAHRVLYLSLFGPSEIEQKAAHYVRLLSQIAQLVTLIQIFALTVIFSMALHQHPNARDAIPCSINLNANLVKIIRLVLAVILAALLFMEYVTIVML
jgi:hypothetical protein